MDNNKNINLQKPHSMVTFSDPNEKQYLVLMIGTEDGREFRDWEFITGRKEVYDFIKNLVLSEQYDLGQSMVIAEGQPVENGLSFIKFMHGVIENGLINDPGFDIMDYVPGDDEEEE